MGELVVTGGVTGGVAGGSRHGSRHGPTPTTRLDPPLEPRNEPLQDARHGSTRDAAHDAIDCRAGCGACCIAPSITTPFRGMPHGKRAGERCAHLDDADLCGLFGHPDRPAFCAGLRPTRSMCGATTGEALAILTRLELATRPDASSPVAPTA